MWASTTKKNIARLQKVQNFAARIVTGARKYDHITPMLKELHWLPVAKPHHPCVISVRQEGRCIQEILGIKISLIYHFLDEQQVSDLSHIGLLSSGMTFQPHHPCVISVRQEARCIQEIPGIKISLIYHFLDEQQVSDLSHIGLLSSGMTF